MKMLKSCYHHLCSIVPLKAFRFTDLGAIRHAAASDIPDLMVVAGPNGVGKSTLFEELNSSIEGPTRRGRRNDIEVSENAQSVYLSPHRAPAPSDMSATLLTTLTRESARSRLGSSNYNLNSAEAPDVLRYGTNRRTRKAADFAPFFELKKRLAQLEFDRGQLMADLYDEQGSIPEGAIPNLGQPLKEGIDAVLPGIEYEGVKQTDERDYRIQFNDRSGDQVEFDDLSSGEKDAISLIFNLVEKKIESRINQVQSEEESREDLVVIIDSPEAYLHPAMQERFLNFVQEEIASAKSADFNSSLQVLMCTHSQTIIQNISDNNLYFLLYQDQREENQLVPAQGISLDTLESITGELGVTALSSGNPIVLVEGDSDREILRKLFPEIRDEFEILPMGGKGKIINFSNSFNQVVPELYSKGIFLFAVLDGDRDLDIDSQYTDFVHQLSVTCIENHLLDAEALYKALEMTTGESRLNQEGITNPDDVQAYIAELVESDSFQEKEIKTRLNERLRINVYINNLEQFTTDAISKQIDKVAETKKNRTESIIDEVRGNVSTAVSDREYSRLNGKEILSMLANKFDLQKEVLARVTAEIIESSDSQPDALSEALNEISQTIESHTSSELLDTVEG